jgi:CDP-glucose 4,6-dehydratase
MMSSGFFPTQAFWKDKRVFLTGHTGFKGSWLTAWLASLGAQVRGYALAPVGAESMYSALALDEWCESVLADIRDRGSLMHSLREFEPQIAVHMAAQPLVRRSYADPADTFEVNVQGTVNFLEACRDVRSLRAIVVVTTDKCYENKGGLRAYREEDTLGGRDPYSASKACAELAIAAYRRSYFNGGQPAVASVRAGNVIGGGDWGEDRLIPDAVRAFSAGRPLIVRNPTAIRPWQHVAGPLGGYLMLAHALSIAGVEFASAFNFGPASDQLFSVGELAERLAARWGASAVWRAETEPNAPHEAPALMLDSGRARQRLRWLPDDNLDGAINATVDWYKAFYTGAGSDELRRLTLAHLEHFVPRRKSEAVGSSSPDLIGA